MVTEQVRFVGECTPSSTKEKVFAWVWVRRVAKEGETYLKCVGRRQRVGRVRRDKSPGSVVVDCCSWRLPAGRLKGGCGRKVVEGLEARTS